MSLNVPAYRVTEDDLHDADKKTKRAIGPLLEALNRTLTAAVAALTGLSSPTLMAVSFSTAANGAAYVALAPGVPMTEVWVTALTPKAGTLDTVWSMSWAPQPKGAQLLFQGLAPLSTYSLRVRYF